MLLSPARCTLNPLVDSPALSWWGSERLSGHFADTESLYKEMLFLPRSPGPQ